MNFSVSSAQAWLVTGELMCNQILQTTQQKNAVRHASGEL